jgi:hypothetical protein
LATARKAPLRRRCCASSVFRRASFGARPALKIARFATDRNGWQRVQ